MRNFLLTTVVLLMLVNGSASRDQDKSNHSVGIRLYGKPIREGENEYSSVTVEGKAGYIVLSVYGSNGLSEVARYPLLQAPKMVTKQQRGETIRNWPTGSGLIIASRNKNEWAEPRRNDNGIKVPTPFSKIEISIERRLSTPYDPVTIFATNYDKPETLVKKDHLLLDYQSAQAVYDFIESGTEVTIMIEPASG